MAARAESAGQEGSLPASGFFADAMPCAAGGEISTETSVLTSAGGVGRWSSGLGADMMEQTVRQMVARKVAAADAAFAAGQHRTAFPLYLEALRADSDQARLIFMAGICAWGAGMTDEAGKYLREAVLLQPDHPLVHHGLGDWCIDMGDVTGALHHSGKAVALAPDDPHFATSRASILEATGQRADAWSQVQKLLNEGFSSTKLAAVYARMASGTGQEQAALNLIDKEIRNVTSALEHRMLCMAASGLLDKSGVFDGAFAFAKAGNESELSGYDALEIVQQVQRQIDYFTPAKLHDLPRASETSRRPVFIIGMPRSGTSLVEQILASHPDVHGAGELMAMSDIRSKLCTLDGSTEDFPNCFDSVSLKSANRCAAEYAQKLDALDGSARYVTDKMPMNFLHLGVITTLFPDAHVVHCTRSALDTCLSCYLTDFAVGHRFSRKLEDLGRYYCEYHRLMDHWTGTLNYPMLEVRYEDVVADVPGQARRMLDFLDLPWEDRCVSFHKTNRKIITASRNQVNQPIYSKSVSRWRKYEKHLGPLISALGDLAN